MGRPLCHSDTASEAEGNKVSAPITLTGRLVADPEVKFGASGIAITSLRVVTSGRKLNKETGKWEDVDTTFWSVTAWRQLAENVAESLTKGDQVIVTGKVKSRDWEDKDGNKRTVFEVTADHVGPDLERATAKVNRIQRDKPAAVASDDPWSNTGLVPAQSEIAPF